ncbi:MAG: hypothetical protein WDA30_28355, partial [Mycolicibacterium sp.]
LTKLNGASPGDSTVYYDDRGYRAANGTLIGALNGHLCGATSPIQQPAPTHSLIGVDSSDPNLAAPGKYYRWWTGSNDSNTDCPNRATEYFGTAKALDLWALQKSDSYELPIIIVPPSDPVDVGTLASVTPIVQTGDSAFGTFVFTNAGGSPATGVTYQASLGNPAVPATCPASVNFTLLPAGISATYNPAPACNINFTGMPTTLASGDTLTFKFNYVVLASNPGPIPLTTEIQAANETPGAPAPNTASAQTIVAKPIVSVGKSATPAAGSQVAVGDTITYTLSVNIANAPLTSLLTLDDTLGTGLTFGSVTSSSPAFTCSGSLVCTLPVGTDPGTYSVTYTATVNASAGSSVANQVTATGGGGDNPPTCNPCSVSHPVASPDLAISKDGPTSAAVGVPFDYTITVSNNGSGDATADAAVVDTVPAGLTINSVTTPGCTVSGQVVTCTAPQAALVVGGSVTFTINVTPTAAAIPAVINTATVGGGGDPSCPVATPCPSPPVNTPITWTAGIDLVKTVTSSGPYSSGSTISYSLVATNTGTAPLTGVTISDPLLGALSCTPAAPATLAPGASMSCTGSYLVTGADANAGQVDNTATASGTDPASTPVSATDSTSTPIVQNPALTLDKSVTSTGPYGVGDTITYSFTVQNTGDVTLTGVAVNDPLLGGTIACTPSTLAPGASATCGPVNYTVTPADVDAGHVANTATASGTPPATPGNPTPTPIDSPPDTTDTPIVQNPALTLDKQVTSTGPYGVGDTITYSFTVQNTGDVTLTGVAVNDPLLGGTIACTPATLAPGASATCGPVNYTVTVAEVLAGSVYNTATASGTPPATPSNPTPTPVTAVDDVTTPVVQPGVGVVKSSDPASGTEVLAGQTITYTLTATVSDVRLTDPLVLTDTLSGDQTFGSVTNAGSYTADTSAAPTLVFTLPAGTAPGTYAVSYTATVDSDASG